MGDPCLSLQRAETIGARQRVCPCRDVEQRGDDTSKTQGPIGAGEIDVGVSGVRCITGKAACLPGIEEEVPLYIEVGLVATAEIFSPAHSIERGCLPPVQQTDRCGRIPTAFKTTDDSVYYSVHLNRLLRVSSDGGKGSKRQCNCS